MQKRVYSIKLKVKFSILYFFESFSIIVSILPVFSIVFVYQIKIDPIDSTAPVSEINKP